MRPLSAIEPIKTCQMMLALLHEEFDGIYLRLLEDCAVSLDDDFQHMLRRKVVHLLCAMLVGEGTYDYEEGDLSRVTESECEFRGRMRDEMAAIIRSELAGRPQPRCACGA